MSQDSPFSLTRLMLLQAGLLSHSRLEPASIQLVSDIARALGCDRASLGLFSGSRLRLVAMSHQGETRFKGRLADDLVGAMEEAIDQNAAVSFGAVEEAIGLSLQEPDEGETPAVDSDDEDYESEDKGIDYRFLDPDEDGILTPFGKGKPAAAAHSEGPGPVRGPDRERLERVLAELIACRQLLDNALKDG